MPVEPIKIEGLHKFVRDLKTIDNELPKAVRRAFNEAADLVVTRTRPKVTRRSGRAAGSIKARSTQRKARIIAGGRRAPYYPWLDFGGRVGRDRSIERQFRRDGRWLYPTYFELKASGEVERVMVRALLDVVESAGIEVT